jgi:hypothetical protein
MDACIPSCASLAPPTDAVSPGHRARALRLVAAFALAAGYVDLVRGGLTAAPILLVLGYVVLVPLVLLLD